MDDVYVMRPEEVRAFRMTEDQWKRQLFWPGWVQELAKKGETE